MNIKNNWITVSIPRANLYKFFDTDSIEFGNEIHYMEMHNTCQKLFPETEWNSSIDPITGTKHFNFAHEKYAMLFRLMQM